MNRSKVLEFFDAEQITERVNVIGCGAIGSHVCEQLARLGFAKVVVYDFDRVSAHNITNQMFNETDIGKYKVDAVEDLMKSINPLIEIEKHYEGLIPPYVVNGYIFLCVDNIDLRRDITRVNANNINTKGIFDFRMRLTDAQYYAATTDWQYDMLIETMNFSHEEAIDATPRSACGVELSVVYAPKTIVSFGIANFVKIVKNSEFANMITIDMDTYEVQNFKWKQRKKKDKLGILEGFFK